MDAGLLLLHGVVGLLLAGHGAQKLFGWFGGHGLQGTAGFVESLGWRPGQVFAGLLGVLELGAGLALALGFATPLAAGMLAAVLANAAWFVHRRNGLWNTAGGFEYPLALAAAAVSLAFPGAGRVSVDHLLGWSPAGPGWGALAAGLGVAGLLAGATARWVSMRGSRGRSGAAIGQAA